VPTIITVFSCIILYSGYLLPIGEQASNMVDGGWKLVGIGVILYFIEILVSFVVRAGE